MNLTQWSWRAAALGIAWLFSGGSTAEESREHDAHEHGHGALDVVATGDELIMTLRIPAANVVGFEHAPSNDEQRQAMETALSKFGQGDVLFSPSSAAKCRAEAADAEFEGMDGDDTHSEMHAEYRFVCGNFQALKQVEVRVFAHLIDVEELDARVVTDTLQVSAELNADDPVLILAR